VAAKKFLLSALVITEITILPVLLLNVMLTDFKKQFKLVFI